MTDHGKYIVNDSEAKAAVLEILAQGHSVELPAKGLSMFPTFRPGDKVVVRPVRKDEMPEKGEVVVYVEEGAGRRAQGGGEEEGAGRRAQGAGHRAQGAGRRAQGTGEEQIFVMHRLIEISKDYNGDHLFITRGDSRMEADEPWKAEQLVGVAVSARSGKKERKVKSFIPSEFRYKLNWWMLWGWGKIGSMLGRLRCTGCVSKRRRVRKINYTRLSFTKYIE